MNETEALEPRCRADEEMVGQLREQAGRSAGGPIEPVGEHRGVGCAEHFGGRPVGPKDPHRPERYDQRRSGLMGQRREGTVRKGRGHGIGARGFVIGIRR